MFRNIASLSHAPGSFSSITLQKQTEKKIKFVIIRGGGVGGRGRNWMKVIKRYKLPVIG